MDNLKLALFTGNECVILKLYKLVYALNLSDFFVCEFDFL